MTENRLKRTSLSKEKDVAFWQQQQQLQDLETKSSSYATHRLKSLTFSNSYLCTYILGALLSRRNCLAEGREVWF